MVQRRVILFRSYGVCAGPDTQEDYRDSNGEFMYMQCLEYVLGQAHRRITEIQTGGACIYNASLFGWPFLLVWHGQGNKTANCLFFDYYQDTYRAEIGRVS
jgi:hypothetical protein